MKSWRDVLQLQKSEERLPHVNFVAYMSIFVIKEVPEQNFRFFAKIRSLLFHSIFSLWFHRFCIFYLSQTTDLQYVSYHRITWSCLIMGITSWYHFGVSPSWIPPLILIHTVESSLQYIWCKFTQNLPQATAIFQSIWILIKSHILTVCRGLNMPRCCFRRDWCFILEEIDKSIEKTRSRFGSRRAETFTGFLPGPRVPPRSVRRMFGVILPTD